MRYPGLPPAGGGDPRSGWAKAGSDLEAAEQLLYDPATVDDRVMLAEVLRRRGRVEEALETLHGGLSEGRSHPIWWLAEGNARWGASNLSAAKAAYETSFGLWSERGDHDGLLAARLGMARCDRMNVGKRGRSSLETAVDASRAVTDADLLADLYRERAAWALLEGAYRESLRHAEAAVAIHQRAGDRYLGGQAEVLVARAWNALDEEERAITILEAVHQTGTEISSFDLTQLSTVYLGNLLQRAATPDSPRWQAAKTMLEEELGFAVDPITRAEMLLPLAHLDLAAGEYGQARTKLDEYLSLYEAIGGNRVSTGNYYKAIARLELAAGGGSAALHSRLLNSPRVVAALHTARKNMRRAADEYALAGHEPGRRSVEEQRQALGDIVAGRPLKGRVPAEVVGQFNSAVANLQQGESLRAARRWSQAQAAYRAAEAAAAASGSTAAAVAATVFRAEVSFAAGDTADVADAIRATLRHSESIRASIAVGQARGNVGSAIRSHYERAAVLGARIGAVDLVFELVERLRTERLAGLLRTGTQAFPDEIQDLIAQIDHTRIAMRNTSPGMRPVRSIAAVNDLAGTPSDALEAQLDELYAALSLATTGLFADAVGAVPVDWAAAAAVPEDVLALISVPDGAAEVMIVVWRPGRGRGAVTITEVDDDLARLRDTLVRPDRDGLLGRVNLTSADLQPVRRVLPPEFTSAVAEASVPVKLVVVPSAWLWAVPFAGVPLDDEATRVLVDVADIVLAPSLRFFIELSNRQQADVGDNLGAVSWIAPDSGISAGEFDALEHHLDHVALASPDAVREAFVDGGHRFRTAALAAHGNREPGMAQAVLDGRRPVLAASDYLNGSHRPPRFLSLASCHSAYPGGDDPHEPLGLALAALTAGVQQVVSATFEMDAHEGLATTCLRQFYAALATTDAAPAALCQVLRERRTKSDPLFRWAVLSVIGIHSPT